MTTRHTGYLVTLDKDIREDDAEGIINAIKQIKHVVRVEPAPADSMDVSMAKARLRSELGGKLYKLLHEETT